MSRVSLVLSLVGLATAALPVARSREEIQAFREFLEDTKSSDGAQFLDRSRRNPLANPEENSGRYQGDLNLEHWMIERMVQEYAAGRNAYTLPDTYWPNDTVVWEFGEGEFDQPQKEAILAGIADIESHTCIKFRYREPEDTAFVRVTGNSSGCIADIGYWEPRGEHLLNLARNDTGVGCFRHANIVHEWLHILGILHMHSTHNRDDYVQIVGENITPGLEHNFDIYTSDVVSNLGVEYDYVSCMHYGAYAFSENGKETIVALQDHEGEMGQRDYITDKDWLRLNRHYKCPGT